MPTSVAHLFSASQHESFNHLSKQLRFLKFQSINSTSYNSNIAPISNNLAPAANPFDKFIYLSNSSNPYH